MKNNQNATIHSKFTSLFDKGWNTNTSRLRTKHADDRSYDPTHSWDGQSDDPRRFSRLRQTSVPTQSTKPITLADSAVVELDPAISYEVLNVFQGNDNSKLAKTIPLSIEQKDINMANDLSCSIPMTESLKDTNNVIILKQAPKFSNNLMNGPVFEEITPPSFLHDADKKILLPKQRREILEYEKKKVAADLYLKQAVAAREKLIKKVNGQEYNRGILMVDSCNNEESEIYGAKAKRAHADKEYKAQIHLERKGYLALRCSSLATNGNILVPESILPRVQTEAFYQSKGGNTHALSFDETHNRLFCRGAEKGVSGTRTQFQRDNELSGKQHNIINHTIIEHWPSRHMDRLYDKKLLHPSQTSLESTRNTVGSIIRHDRLI